VQLVPFVGVVQIALIVQQGMVCQICGRPQRHVLGDDFRAADREDFLAHQTFGAQPGMVPGSETDGDVNFVAREIRQLV
jgi:hypothetical protein